MTDPVARRAFIESQNRIKSMSLIHEQLYKTRNVARIDFRGYVGELASQLLRSYGRTRDEVELDLQIADLPVGIDRGIPCGIIINELVSNALKYAFPDGRHGVIGIRLQEEATGTAELTVRDNGVGIPESFTLASSSSLGLQLVHMLVEQLQGTIEIAHDRGTQARIRFPL